MQKKINSQPLKCLSVAIVSLFSALSINSVSAEEVKPGSAVAEQASASVLTQTQELEKRVFTLLDKAVEHVKENGVSAVNDFNNDPRFIDNELYVYTLSSNGVLLSSGGWSVGMVGQNVLDERDEQEKPFFKTLLDKAQELDQGEVSYVWFNPTDGTNETKITHFKVVDNVVVAVGYFPPFATEEQAKELLVSAVSEYQKNPEVALRKFRNQQSGFRNQDQYVFVLDKAERTIVWAPANIDLIDTSLDQVQDIQGKTFLSTIADTAIPDVMQEVDYWWFSPITKRVELRRAFYQQVDEKVIAVGTFILKD